MLILKGSDLEFLLPMPDVIQAVEQGFRALADGRGVVPDRLTMTLPQGVLLQMPSSLEEPRGSPAPLLGTKIVSVFEANAAKEIPVVAALYLLLDGETGHPLALMEGAFMTALRTAATSAVATMYMAGTHRDGLTLAILGAGVQGRHHVEAMTGVREVSRVLVCSKRQGNAARFANDVSGRYGIASEAVTAEEAVARADLICTCTTSPTPLFDGSLLKPGTHINAVGAFTPSTRELDTLTVKRSRVIIDAECAAGRESGELLIPLAEGEIDLSHIRGSLAEVVSGRVAGRESEDEITLFKSCGLAIEDLVTADLAFRRARERGVGTRVEL